MSQDAISPELVKAACDKMYRDVYVPAFFAKLASYDIRPNTQADAEYLLAMDQALQEKEAAEYEANEPNPLLKEAFEAVTGANGVDRRQRMADLEHDALLTKQASELVVEDEELLQAALIYQAALTGQN